MLSRRLLILAVFVPSLSWFPALSADEASSTIQLFNGKDLTHFYTFLKGYGKNNDPKKVFTVVQEDGAPAIRVSGEVFGCFTTEKEFENYKLTVEYKWGNKTFPPREKATRDSGILLHCVGPDGAASGYWMESIEYQLIEGGTGDFIVVGGNKTIGPQITVEVEDRPTGPKGAKQPYYKPGGEPRVFTSGRVNWYGRAANWTDTLGFRGPEDVEKPLGEWNTVEIICDGNTIISKLNGKIVNKATNVRPSKGKILFQSEGAEIFFRKIDLTPLKK